jgi:lysophospholipase L1-like esterase
MWHPTLDRDLAPLRVIPRGFGGSTWLDVIHYTDRLVLPYRPRAVLVYEGDNDIDFGATPEEAFALFRSFVARVRHSLPELRLYVMSAKPSSARWAKWPAMRRLNEMVAAACAEDPLAWYVDVATPMLGEDGRPLASIFLEDELHMNARGYEIWTEVVRREVVSRERGFE